MNWTITWLFLGTVAWLLAYGFSDRRRIYEYPFFAGIMAFAFIAPQMPAVAADPFIHETAYVKTIAIAILALIMIRLGWAAKALPVAPTFAAFSERRLLIGAMIMTLVGSVFYFQLSRLSGDLVVGVQMTGLPVAYLFFARLLIYGLAIAVMCFARRPSLTAGIIIAIALIFCLDRILVTGKRAEALEIVLIFALAFFFHRGWLVSRAVVAIGIVLATLAMSSLSDYRQITRETGEFDAARIADIDVLENFRELLAEGGDELRNAVQRIGQTDRRHDFDFGAVHWNRLVFNYVPAQLIGHTRKQALMIATPQPDRDYQPATGTTETGMVDAFQSFWYFGVVKFLILAYAMARLWAAANAGSTAAQIVYVLSIVPAMHAISHMTDWVIQAWVHMLFFLAPVLLFARLSRRRVKARQAEQDPSRPRPPTERPVPA